jgi:hypothetical protein
LFLVVSAKKILSVQFLLLLDFVAYQEKLNRYPAESGGKTRGVKKVSLCDDNSVEKLKKQPIFYAKGAQIIAVFFTNKPIIFLVYKEAYFNTNNLDSAIPSVVVSLLQEFDDVFPKDISSGLPPLRGIEHQIDRVPGASIPNRPAYRSNPEETKEIQRQVDMIQARSNSDFDVKSATIQFYGNNHSSQSDRWMGLKVYVESPDMLSYLGLKFQVN